MREHQLAGHIANSPNTGDVGLHLFIDFNHAAVTDFDARRFESQPFAVRCKGSCHQHLIHFQSLIWQLYLDLITSNRNAFKLHAGLNLDTDLG